MGGGGRGVNAPFEVAKLSEEDDGEMVAQVRQRHLVAPATPAC